MSLPEITVDVVSHSGWPHALRLANADIELVVTLDVGPRIIFYGRPGGQNALGLLSGDLGGQGEAGWKLRGGHRLWAAPEDPEVTYTVDNSPVTHQTRHDGVRLWTDPDPVFKIGKSLDIHVQKEGSEIRLTHRLRNAGPTPRQMSVWALTVVAPGGIEIVPLPGKGHHPQHTPAATAADFAPGQVWALWPYFSFVDPRVGLSEKYLTLRHDPARSATKLGLSHREGWVSHVGPAGLFVKQFGYMPGALYPDGGCNFETFTNADIHELESLGPLEFVPPGGELEHVETWRLLPLPADVLSLFAGLNRPTDAQLDAAMAPLLAR